MRPEDLIQLLTSMGAAADLVDALDDPAGRGGQGWELTGWTYEPVPWGVRFFYRPESEGVAAAVVALAMPEARRARFARAYAGSPWPTTLLLLG